MASHELTRLQIQKIDHYLQTKCIHYLDVRMEVVDHIATNIEGRMSQNNTEDFRIAFQNEIHSWDSETLDRIVDEKRSALSNYWKKRMGYYLLSYFKFPKILGVLSSFLILVVLILSFGDHNAFVRIAGIGLGLFFAVSMVLGLMYGYIQGNYQEDLLSIEAYKKALGIVSSLPWMGVIFSDYFPKIELSQTSIIMVLCGLIIVSLVLSHATYWIFPKMMKEEILNKYEPLISLAN